MKKYILLTISLFGAIQFCLSQGTMQGINCESKYNAAETVFNMGKYELAAKMYQDVIENCQGDYGGAAARLAECRRRLAETDESAAWEECKDSNDPNVLQAYMNRFPNGRHFNEVKQRRTMLLAQWAAANETARENIAYSRCNTISGCEEYLANYPTGRYVTQVLNKKRELERAIAEREQRRREREAAQLTAFMDKASMRVQFGNAYDIDGIVMKDDFGSMLYASDMRFLVPKLIYNSRLSDEREVTLLYCQIIHPNGSLMHSFFNGMYVEPGRNNSTYLAGFGNGQASVFDPGTYRFDIWYDDVLLYTTEFTLNGKDYALSSAGWRQTLARCLEIPTETYEEDIYKGCLNAGERSRLGVYYWSSSTCYFGNWRQGERDGWGILVVRDGYEVSNCPDCAYYVGPFKNGVKSGEGTCYDRAGNLIYYGQFVDDSPVGTYPMSGYGNYKFICIDKGNGNYYLGEVENEQPEGKGIFMQSNGDLWLGTWKGGQRDGTVLYLPYDGAPVMERWSNGVKK